MHLVLIETSGNQRYIFSTNKLRENVGASELTYRAGTQWVLEAVADEASTNRLWSEEADTLLANLQNQPRIEEGKVSVEVIIATSGKALLLTKTVEIGRAIIGRVTTRALTEAPGLDICGVVSKGFDWDTDCLDQQNRFVHEAFEEMRTRRPGPDLRFLRLPIVAECATSGLPAQGWDSGPDAGPRSAVSLGKRDPAVIKKALNRVQKLLEKQSGERKWLTFASSIDALEKVLEQQNSWLAVVHSDGNGLGEIFLNFGSHIGQDGQPPPNRDYVDKYRRFSLALDVCTEKAFLRALDAFDPGTTKSDVVPLVPLVLGGDVVPLVPLVLGGDVVPLVPLVLGGDDMTVVCDGAAALDFTHRFLRAFEDETSKDEHFRGIVAEVALKALKVGRLSACAGIAIVKTHFPFSVAYDLAEDLIASAKTVKEKVKRGGATWPCSAIDFHVLYDTSDVTLAGIRAHLSQSNPVTRLFSRPFIVTDPALLAGTENSTWQDFRRWEQLEKRVVALNARQADGRRRLPNSQMHDLRAGLFLGKEAADARFKLMRNRYSNAKIDDVAASKDSLFWKEGEEEDKEFVTGLLDAMDAAGFWAFDKSKDGSNDG